MIDFLVFYYTWLLEMAPLLILIAVSTFFHEFGHYIIAKRENNYKGWGLIPFPHIKLKKLGSRFGYLAGFLFSMIALPLWVVVFELQTFWIYIIIQMGAAGADFMVIIFYVRLMKKREKRLREREAAG